MADLLLRSARPSDAGRLGALAAATFRETFLEDFAVPYPAKDLQVFMAANHTEASLAAKLADPGQAVWLVEQDGEVLAYANAGRCTLRLPEAKPTDGELKRLYVLRSARGLGLGRRLMETALDWLRRETPGTVWLGVWSGNLKAQRFYAAYGFEKAGDYLFPVGDWRDEEFILKRP